MDKWKVARIDAGAEAQALLQVAWVMRRYSRQLGDASAIGAELALWAGRLERAARAHHPPAAPAAPPRLHLVK